MKIRLSRKFMILRLKVLWNGLNWAGIRAGFLIKNKIIKGNRFVPYCLGIVIQSVKYLANLTFLSCWHMLMYMPTQME